jgi:hypothetical protein
MKIMYRGQYLGDKAIFEKFAVLMKDDQIHSEIEFAKSRGITGYRVGHVYTIDDPKKESYKFGSTQWVGEHPDTEMVANVQARAQAERVRITLKQREKKEAKNDSALQPLIAPLREIYQTLPHNQRAAFQQYLVNQLNRRAK